MHLLLDPLFTLFGERGAGQLFGAALVGAILPALMLWPDRDSLPGGHPAWILGGAAVGLTAGLFLLSPRRFLGSVLVLLGIALIAVPMSHADGSPATMEEYSAKVAVGLALLLPGAILLLRAWRRLRMEPPIQRREAADDAWG